MKQINSPSSSLGETRHWQLSSCLIDPSLLYLLGDPEDPKVVWKKLADEFQKKTWANKLALRRRLNNPRLREGDSVQKHVKEMTEIFNDLSVIGAAMDEEDKVVTLLASLPDSSDMLVTALEANATVPTMETVTERLLHEERKLNEREISVTSSEKRRATNLDILRNYVKNLTQANRKTVQKANTWHI